MLDDRELRDDHTKQGDEKPSPSPADDLPAATHPAAPLVAILPRKLVVWLAISALVLAVLSFILGIFAPERGEHPIARFMFCANVALALSIFFFVMYPQNLRLNVPVLGSTATVIGPIVLFFVVLYAMNQLMPKASPAPPGWRRIPISSDQMRTYSRSIVNFLPAESDDQVFLHGDARGYLDCVFVYFRSHEAIKGDFNVVGEAVYDVSFSVDDTQFSIKRAD